MTFIEHNHGEIKVSGIGEISSFPDCCNIVILLKSTKANLPAAESSVQRRIDYARQEIRNYRFRVSFHIRIFIKYLEGVCARKLGCFNK